jgi:F420-dependent oxidoreductase-like protein
MQPMKLGLLLEAWNGRDLQLPIDNVRLVEQLGYDSVWSSEAYGADALSPLAYLAAITDRIKLATSVVQIAARTPAATAMHFATIDALAGGNRVIAGLGLSGPQIVEGWYGQPWSKPIARTRDTVAIMRAIWARKGPVEYHGDAISLPYDGPGSVGLGKPLKSILHMNPDIPVYIAAGGPANVKLAAEIADGWMPMGFDPFNAASFRPLLEEGAARSGRDLDTLEIHSGCSVVVTDDVRGAFDAIKPMLGMYVGGMGSKEHNFHKDAMIRRGFGDAAERIQELFLAGRKDEAIAAVPDDFIDSGGLYGSPERIRERWEPWTRCGITGLTIRAHQPEALELMADLAGSREGVHA